MGSKTQAERLSVVLPGGDRLDVRSVYEASRQIVGVLERSGMGGTEFYETKGVGDVYRAGEKKPFAFISYNGRAWKYDPARPRFASGHEELPTPPNVIGGVPVDVHGEPLEVKGQNWVTLVPRDTSDERIWEWSIETGKLLQTKGARR